MSFKQSKKDLQIERKAIFLGYRGLIVPTENGYELIGSFTSCGWHDEALMDWLRKHYKEQGKHVADMEYSEFEVGAYILTESGEPYLLVDSFFSHIKLCKPGKVTPIGMPNKKEVVEVSFINYGIQFRTSAGNVYGCGENECGNLGIGNKEEKSDKLVCMPMPGNQKIIKLSNGGDNLVITEESKVYRCGNNYYGQFSCDGKDMLIPTFLKDFSDEKIIEISSSNHSIFLTKKGDVFTCGYNCYGQLGHGHTENVNIPTKVKSLTNIASICVKKYNSYFVTKDNKVYACGSIEGKDIVAPIEMEFFRGKGIVKIRKTECNIYFISKYGDIYVSGWPLKNEPENVKGIRLLNVKCMKERLRNQSSKFFLKGKQERNTYFMENMFPSSLFITGDSLDLEKPNKEPGIETQKPEPYALKK